MMSPDTDDYVKVNKKILANVSANKNRKKPRLYQAKFIT